MRKSWVKKRALAMIRHEGFDGVWLDVGLGECQSCDVLRRMYRPVKRLDVHLCAECVRLGCLVSLPDSERGESVDDDNNNEVAA